MGDLELELELERLRKRVSELEARAAEERRLRMAAEEKLAGLEAAFLNVIHSIPVSIMIKDSEGRFVVVNESAARLLGRQPEHVIGKISYDMMTAHEAAAIREMDRQVLSTGKPCISNVMFEQEAGAGFCYRVIKTTYELTGGVKRIMSVLTDISEQVRNKADLRSKEKKLELFFSRCTEGIMYFTFDSPLEWNDSIDKEAAFEYMLDHLRISEVNDALTAQMGMTREQLIGMTPRQMNAGDRDKERKLWRMLLDEGKSQMELQLRKRDGSLFWIEGEYFGLYDEAGRIVGHFGIQRDITDRKRTEEALRKSEEKYRNIVEIANDIIYSLDAGGIFTYVSPNWSDSLDYRAEEVVGRHYSAYFHPDDLQSFRQFYSDVNSGGGRQSVEFRIRHKDGTWRWYKSNASAQADSTGSDKPFIVIAHDITDLKQTQQKLQDMNRILQYRSNIDGLTLIANRRYFDEMLGKEWRRSGRMAQPIAMIMLDIDCYKAFNDTYGHHLGDECLRRIAGELESILKRPGDFVARYGGEEFAIILPDTSLEGARSLAESIRRSIESLNIPHAASDVSGSVTASLGVATMVPTASIKTKELVIQADRALYAAKQNGRNRVEVY